MQQLEDALNFSLCGYFLILMATMCFTAFSAVTVQYNKSRSFIIKNISFVNWAYENNVNIFGGSIHTVKKNPEALVAATKDTGLEVNANKIKYMTVFRDQNVG